MSDTQTETQKEFQQRVNDVVAFATEKEVAIYAVQKLNENGCIETVPFFRDLKPQVVDTNNSNEPAKV